MYMLLHPHISILSVVQSWFPHLLVPESPEGQSVTLVHSEKFKVQFRPQKSSFNDC